MFDPMITHHDHHHNVNATRAFSRSIAQSSNIARVSRVSRTLSSLDAIAMKISMLTLLLAPSAVSFVAVPVPAARGSDIATLPVMRGAVDDIDGCEVGIHDRREVFRTGSLILATVLGFRPDPSQAEEMKSYSSNARNMARLKAGDGSGGSIYDNNPSSPKARARRAMVGCKDSGARSLAGENLGKKKLSEKDCNLQVMSGDSDFMLGALTELDCPACPYGIGSR